jgi:hypothetical protein
MDKVCNFYSTGPWSAGSYLPAPKVIPYLHKYSSNLAQTWSTNYSNTILAPPNCQTGPLL